MPTVKIKGMSCQHCVASVTEALSKISGISEVNVNLEAGEAVYKETGPVDGETIKKAVSDIGFEVG